MGTVNLNIFPPLNITHIGCHLSTKYWNKGYASELMKTLVEYGFEERQLPAIHAVVEINHTASKKLFLNLGFSVLKKLRIGNSDLEIYQKKRD